MKYFIMSCMILFFSVFGWGKNITPRLRAVLDTLPENQPAHIWVYFTDKPDDHRAYEKALTITSRAAERRRDIPTDWYDLPVNDRYLDEMANLGAQRIRPSRWLNAASAYLTRAMIEELAVSPFVVRIDQVNCALRPLPEFDRTPPPRSAFYTDYGPSYWQNHMLMVDSVHARGYNGAGVLIALFDTGFLPTLEVFDSLSVLGTYDFINDDSDVTDSFPSHQQPSHGTTVLSVCGGFDSGELIGPAYKADYLLAKTEEVVREIQAEEDNWVLAAEWADSLGADIISSSLGYLDWYSYVDMDGNTAVTTIAADLAVSRGILVVNCVGNEGNDAWHYMNAPADGDSVLAVGAVTSSGMPSDFTSYGPTYDGRVKPEVVAMGSSVYGINEYGIYSYHSGTSYSTPEIAGVAALMIQANPALRGAPMELIEQLIRTAHLYPDSDPGHRLGYGVPNALRAVYGLHLFHVPTIVVDVGDEETVPLLAAVPVNQTATIISYDLPADYDLIDYGDGTADLVIVGLPQLAGGRTYHVVAATAEVADTVEVTVITKANDVLLYAGPNPFTEEITFYFTRPVQGGCTIKIFTLSGELVFSDRFEANPLVWRGINQENEKVAPGVYIIRIFADGMEKEIKVFKY